MTSEVRTLTLITAAGASLLSTLMYGAGGLGVVEKPEQIPLDMAALREALHPIAQLVPNVELWMEPGPWCDNFCCSCI